MSEQIPHTDFGRRVSAINVCATDSQKRRAIAALVASRKIERVGRAYPARYRYITPAIRAANEARVARYAKLDTIVKQLAELGFKARTHQCEGAVVIPAGEASRLVKLLQGVTQ